MPPSSSLLGSAAAVLVVSVLPDARGFLAGASSAAGLTMTLDLVRLADGEPSGVISMDISKEPINTSQASTVCASRARPFYGRVVTGKCRKVARKVHAARRHARNRCPG